MVMISLLLSKYKSLNSWKPNFSSAPQFIFACTVKIAEHRTVCVSSLLQGKNLVVVQLQLSSHTKKLLLSLQECFCVPFYMTQLPFRCCVAKFLTFFLRQYLSTQSLLANQSIQRFLAGNIFISILRKPPVGRNKLFG